MEEVTPAEIEALHDEFGDRPHPPPAHRERRALAWAIATPWLLAAVLRVLALDGSHPLISAYAFVPFAAVTSFVPLVVALFLRVRLTALAAGVAMAVFVLIFAGRALPGPNPPASGREFRVMTLNTLVGGADVQTVIDLVGWYQVDVLALQELTPQMALMLHEDGLDGLLPYSVEDSRSGPAGGGVWSRTPVVRTFKQTAPDQMESPEVSIASLGVRVRSVHPMPPTSDDRVRRWKQSLAALPAPSTSDGALRIYAGDFNATLDHKALRAVLDRGFTDAADATGQGLVTTWPAGARFALPLDHVLVDKHIRVQSVKILRVSGSDHRAVIAKLRLP